jgi:Fe-S-cluster-containing hydrogenase component 2
MGVLLITPEKCTNCRSCELACSFIHEEEFNPARSRVTVLTWGREAHSVAVMCLQCEEAGCMAICPARAITEDKASGARLVNPTKCVKCRMCIHICPFGSTSYDAKGHKILKCDLCEGDPQCAKVCPSGAIVYGERSTVNVAKRQQAAGKLKAIVRGVRAPCSVGVDNYCG